MPFVEIEPLKSEWVRIAKDRVIVSFDLRKEYLTKPKKQTGIGAWLYIKKDKEDK